MEKKERNRKVAAEAFAIVITLLQSFLCTNQASNLQVIDVYQSSSQTCLLFFIFLKRCIIY